MEVLRYFQHLPRLEGGAALYVRRVHLSYEGVYPGGAGVLAGVLSRQIAGLQDSRGAPRGYAVGRWSAAETREWSFVALEVEGGLPGVQFRIRALGAFKCEGRAPVIHPLHSEEQWERVLSMHGRLGGTRGGAGFAVAGAGVREAAAAARAEEAYAPLRSAELHDFREALVRSNEPGDRTIYWLCDSAGWAESSAHADYLAALGSAVVCRIPTERALTEALRGCRGTPAAVILDIVGSMSPVDDHGALFALAQRARDGTVVPGVGRLPVLVFSDYVPRMERDAMEIDRWAFCIPGPGREIAQVLCGRLGGRRAQQVLLAHAQADAIPEFADIGGLLVALRSYAPPGVSPGAGALDAAWRALQSAFSAETLERYWRSGFTPIISLRWGVEIRLDPAALRGDVATIGGLSIIPRRMTPEQQRRCMEWLSRHRGPPPALAEINARRALAGRPPLEAIPEVQCLPPPGQEPGAPAAPGGEAEARPPGGCHHAVAAYLLQAPHPAADLFVPELPDYTLLSVRGVPVAVETDTDPQLRSRGTAHRVLVFLERGIRVVRLRQDDLPRHPKWGWQAALRAAVEGAEPVSCVEAEPGADGWRWVREEVRRWRALPEPRSAADYLADPGGPAS